MQQEIYGYLEYLNNFKELTRPAMPNFDLSAYSDSEYTNAINAVMNDFENVDDINITIERLKGNWWI